MAAEGSLSRCPAGGFSEALGGGGERETESRPRSRTKGRRVKGETTAAGRGFLWVVGRLGLYGKI